MDNKIIWVDLDECLASTIDKLLIENDNKIWDLIVEVKDIVNYYVHKIPGTNLDEEKAIQLFRSTLFWDHWKNLIKPIEWSLEKLLELKSQWHDLQIITARHDELSNYTYDWLEQNYPSIFKDVHFAWHFTKGHRNKSEICKDIWAKTLIEDNYDYALDVANHWIKAYLFNKPWNNHIKEIHKNMIRFGHWDKLKVK